VLPVLLAGASAVVWGAADFCGGVASLRGKASLRDRALIVAVLAHVCALPAILPFLFWVPGRLNASAMLWGAAAGLGSLAGIIALNLGLASGSMATVAPVAAVTAALVPLAGGMLVGDRPGFGATVGAAAAVGAILLVSGAWPTTEARQQVWRRRLAEAFRARLLALAAADGESSGAASASRAAAKVTAVGVSGSGGVSRNGGAAAKVTAGGVALVAAARVTVGGASGKGGVAAKVTAGGVAARVAGDGAAGNGGVALLAAARVTAGGLALRPAAPREATAKASGSGSGLRRDPRPVPLSRPARPTAGPTARRIFGGGGRPGAPRRYGGMTPQVLALALASGVAFGLFFLMLGQAGKEAGMWPLIADKAVSVGLGLLVLRGCGIVNVTVSRGVFVLGALAGSFDAIATALYLMSSHAGHVSIVAPIAALYPASTVVLALIFNKERLRPVQCAGLGLAGVALMLVAS
jgi:uncharacterized membrane protein